MTRTLGMLRVAALCSVAFALGSCYREPAGEKCTIACTDDNACPNGLRCLDKYCVPNGVPDNEATCVPVDTAATWTAVSTGGRHACAVTSKNTLWCWGDNHFAQLGFGQSVTVAPPTAMTTDGWTAVAAGNDFTCGVRNKVIYCWGDNRVGQLGIDPSLEPIAEPRRVEVEPGPGADVFAAATVLDVQAGGAHACALLDAAGERSVWCWGNNQSLELGGGTSLNHRANKVPLPGSDWSSITVAGDIACALSSTGDVWCWGKNDNSQIITKPPLAPTAQPPTKLDVLANNNGHIRKVATNGASVCAIVDYDDSSEGLLCWGYASFRVAEPPDNLRYRHAVALFPEKRSGWRELAMGVFYGCARDGDGLLQCFGPTTSGEIANGSWANDNAAIAYAAPALNGYAVTFGTYNTRFGCGINAGALACWGDNQFGQLGHGTSSIAPPTVIAAPSQQPWRSVYAVGDHTCGIDDMGKLFCWGSDAYGAHSSVACPSAGCFTATPTAAAAHPEPVDDVTIGVVHVCALRRDHTLYCSGGTDGGVRGPSGLPDPLVNIVADVNAEQWLAVKGANRLVCAQHMPEAAEPADWYCWGTVALTPTELTGLALTKVAHPIEQLTAGHYGDTGVYAGYAILRDSTDQKWYGAGISDGTLPYGVNPGSANYANLTALNYETELTLNFAKITGAVVGGELLCGVTKLTGANPGKVYCWGYNNVGQAGRSHSATDFRVAQPKEATVTLLHNTATCTDVSVGTDAACAVCKADQSADNTVQCWGSRDNGRLGKLGEAIVEPDYMPHTVPLPALQVGDAWRSVVQGAAHVCALSTAGVLACWGDSRFGQAGTGTSNVNTPQPILEVLK